MHGVFKRSEVSAESDLLIAVQRLTGQDGDAVLVEGTEKGRECVRFNTCVDVGAVHRSGKNVGQWRNAQG
jgi:hypothetical protein